MKYYFVDRKGNKKKLSNKQVRTLLTPDQQYIAIESKKADPLEEVAFMVSNGFVVAELD